LTGIITVSYLTPNNTQNTTEKLTMRAEEFLDAARNGDLKRVQEILKKRKVNINKKDEDGRTALMLASEYGHIEVVKSLLANGANINENGYFGETALILASENRRIEIVKYLLANGANINDKDNYGTTALISASQEGPIEIVKSLLANGANVNEKDKYGKTALISASQWGHIEIVKSLLANGANINDKDKYGITALIWAIKKGHIEVVKYLLANGANPTIRTNENYNYYPNMTARDIATRENKKEIVLLLENGERFVFFISFVRPAELFGVLGSAACFLSRY